MDEIEAWVTIIKYGVIFCIAAGMCYTALEIAELFA